MNKITDKNVTVATVKVYEKKYKTKSKRKKETIKTTQQKIITLNKDAPFINNEPVVILKEEIYFKLASDKDDAIFNPIDPLAEDVDAETSKLYETIAEKDAIIEQLNKNIADNVALINKLTTDLRDANEINTINSNKLTDAIVDANNYKSQLDSCYDLINMLTNYNETIINGAVDIAVNNTVEEINKELKETNFIQRLKGLTIVQSPNINKSDIVSDAIAKYNNAINNVILLE